MPPRSRANSIRKKQHTNLDVQSTPSSKSNAVVDKPNSQAITNSIHKHPNSFSPPKPMHKNSGGQHSQASIKNFKAQLDQNFRVLKRHHHNLYGIVDFTNHAVLYKYSEETADWVKEGVEGTLFILMVLDTDEYILKIMNRLTPVDYNENISPSLDIHLVDEYIIYKTPDQGILGLWIYQEKDRIRITECLNRCSSAASNNQPNNKPPCLYTIDDFKGRANTPLASNQTSKLIELYENSIRKAQPNFALAPAVTKTVSDDGAIPQAAQNASNSSQSLMFALQSKLQNAALHQIQSNGPQIPTAESSMELKSIQNKLESINSQTTYNFGGNKEGPNSTTIIDALSALRPSLSKPVITTLPSQKTDISHGFVSDTLDYTLTNGNGNTPLPQSQINSSAFTPSVQMPFPPPPNPLIFQTPWGIPPPITCPSCSHQFTPYLPMVPPQHFPAQSSGDTHVTSNNQQHRPNTVQPTSGIACDNNSQRKDSITQDRASEFLRFVQDGLGTKPKEDKPSSADIMTNMTQPLANPRSSEISESTDLLSRLRGLSTATNVSIAYPQSTLISNCSPGPSYKPAAASASALLHDLSQALNKPN